MYIKPSSFIYSIVFCFCLSACINAGNYKNRQFKKIFQLVKSSEKNHYSTSDSILFSYKKSSEGSVFDTLSFYLNQNFLSKEILKSGQFISIPLHDSQFGENVFKVINNPQNPEIEFRFTVFPDPPQKLQYKILEEYNHDINDFTQGLIVQGDTITESTGGYGKSVLKKYNFKTGEEYRNVKLDKKYFGEGITNFKDKIFLLTYKEKEILIFKEHDLEFIRAIPFFSEGWGITHDNHHLIISNGSSSLHFIDPVSFEEIKVLKVFDYEGEVKNLNELEYINGEIFANIWFKKEIVVIDPENGAVIKKIDFNQFKNIHQNAILSENVLNGIAYDKRTKSLFITGKRWPVLYKLKIEK